MRILSRLEFGDSSGQMFGICPRVSGAVMKCLTGFALLVAVLSSPVSAQQPEIHSEHFLHGYPVGTPASNDLVIRDIYALSSNDTRKLADPLEEDLEDAAGSPALAADLGC